MGRETDQEKTTRVRKLLGALRKTYPDVRCALAYRNPLELLMATILSAQCTDERVNRVTPGLFKKYRSAEDYARADIAVLEDEIRSLGFFRNKARSIRGCCQAIVERYGGRVPATMAELTTLPGVGRKTANVVLGDAFGVQEGIAVDTHVTRLAGRLGLSRHREPERIEQDLMRLAPREEWAMTSHWLIWHGRKRCSALKPDCAGCEVAALCPSAGRVKRIGKPAGPRPAARRARRGRG